MDGTSWNICASQTRGVKRSSRQDSTLWERPAVTSTYISFYQESTSLLPTPVQPDVGQQQFKPLERHSKSLFVKKKKGRKTKIDKECPFLLAQDFDKIHLAFPGIIFTYLHKTCNAPYFSNQAPFCSLPQDETHHYLKKQGQIVQLTASICQNVSPQHFFLNKHEEIKWPLNCFLTYTKSTEIRKILWKELYNFSTQWIFS